MENYAYFYNSSNKDREYDADSLTDWLLPFFTTGVFNGQLQVTANDNMTVSISDGYCNIKGKVKHFLNTTTLDLETASGTLNRIDNVILRRDDTQRDIYLMIKTGGNAKKPTAPELTRNDTIHDLKLAEIYVTAGTIAVTQADITDKRMDANVCGWVASTVKEIDFSQISAQYEAWFQRMKDQLSEDAAGNLQIQIDDINEQQIPSLLPKTGGTMTGPINMSGNKITGLGTPTEDGDAVPKSYIDDDSGWMALNDGGTYGHIFYRKIGHMVEINGAWSSGTGIEIPTWDSIMIDTLPEGFRPTKEILLPLVCKNLNNVSYYCFRIIISENGEVKIGNITSENAGKISTMDFHTMYFSL